MRMNAPARNTWRRRRSTHAKDSAVSICTLALVPPTTSAVRRTTVRLHLSRRPSSRFLFFRLSFLTSLLSRKNLTASRVPLPNLVSKCDNKLSRIRLTLTWRSHSPDSSCVCRIPVNTSCNREVRSREFALVHSHIRHLAHLIDNTYADVCATSITSFALLAPGFTFASSRYLTSSAE